MKTSTHKHKLSPTASDNLTINAHILGSFKCADENGVCKCTGTVIYGHDSTWTSPRDVENEITCSNAVFGDPIPGPVKECICVLPGMLISKSKKIFTHYNKTIL